MTWKVWRIYSSVINTKDLLSIRVFSAITAAPYGTRAGCVNLQRFESAVTLIFLKVTHQDARGDRYVDSSLYS